ncbi:MAG: type II toxin-antitoxin system PemK/MazF family toxin [Bdellovibrionota bacterium]
MDIQYGVLYLADLNPRQGSEAGKIRPVLVIQSDLLNQTGHPSTWVLPCTTRLTGESLIRVFLPKGIAGNDRDCEVMIDQSRAIDNRRLKQKLKKLPQAVFEECKDKLRKLGEL